MQVIYKPSVGLVFHGQSSCGNTYIVTAVQGGRAAVIAMTIDKPTGVFSEPGQAAVFATINGHRPGSPDCLTTASGKPRKRPPGRPRKKPAAGL